MYIPLGFSDGEKHGYNSLSKNNLIISIPLDDALKVLQLFIISAPFVDKVICMRLEVFTMIKMLRPITVAARSKAWTVFARSNAGIMGSNPTQGMDACVCVYFVLVLSCV
jgi:hypothetical protein